MSMRYGSASASVPSKRRDDLVSLTTQLTVYYPFPTLQPGMGGKPRSRAGGVAVPANTQAKLAGDMPGRQQALRDQYLGKTPAVPGCQARSDCHQPTYSPRLLALLAGHGAR